MKEIKILIFYDSRTGNTEKMAFAVAEGVKEMNEATVVVKKVDETKLENLLEADGIIVGSPTYYGVMSSKVKELFDESVKIHGKLTGKVGAAFTSAGGTATGAETTLLSILQAMLVHGMIVQGRADNKHYGVACVGAPNEKAKKLCRELGKRTTDLTAKIVK
ncbi:MAG: NAD(P)H-dependent oxidoreductase [Methanomicrobia archaeon]|nr:NAD(P)H-dependent oxidoreductase [Methanomicrobia archaeon]